MTDPLSELDGDTMRVLADDVDRIDRRTEAQSHAIDDVGEDVDRLYGRVAAVSNAAVAQAITGAVAVLLASAAFVFGVLAWHDPPDAPAVVTADAPPVFVGGTAALAVTPLADLIDARDSIEQAHEGIGNLIKNDLSGDNTCGDRCYAAMQDARQKNLRAWHEVQADVLDIRTWDKDQTVGHAFDSADYWLAQLENVYDIDLAKHAEFQLGILRDVLRSEVTKRTTTTTTTAAVDAATTTIPYPADHYTFDDLSASFDGWATLNLDMIDLEPFLRTVLNQINDTPDEAPCFIHDTIPDTCAETWQRALTEWRGDCDPPRDAANVVCVVDDGMPPSTTLAAVAEPVCAAVLGAINDLGAAGHELAPYDEALSTRARAIQLAVQQTEYTSPNRCVGDYSKPCEAIPKLGSDVLASVTGDLDVPEKVAIMVTGQLADALTALHGISSTPCKLPGS